MVAFTDLRNYLSHDLQKNLKDYDWSPAKKDIERIKEIWTECLTKSGGPYLFRSFTIADGMFAPVVNRFVSYGVPVDGLVKKYIENLRVNKSHLQWIEAGLAENYIAEFH
jgi:glutathione S-transferase